MKPMCAAIRVGCVCAGLLVGISANADWQFSHHVNEAGQETCSAVLNQGHAIEPGVGVSLPRGTLEIFRDSNTSQIRHDNMRERTMPVIAFHWLYPRGTAKEESRTFQYYVWDPRSERLLPRIGTALTRVWDIKYELSYMSEDGTEVVVTGNSGVERVGDVVENDANPGTLRFVDIKTRRNRDYMGTEAVLNSSYWWDIPDAVMERLKDSGEFTLKVSFPGHAGGSEDHRAAMAAMSGLELKRAESKTNTASQHPIEVMWDIKHADQAYAAVNEMGRCEFPAL